MSDDFDWNNSDSVVLRAYGSLAVYENPSGDIVVRQERDALEDEDHFVVIPVQDAELIAQVIIEKANESKRQPAPAPKAEKESRQPRLALPPPGMKTPHADTAKRGVA